MKHPLNTPKTSPSKNIISLQNTSLCQYYFDLQISTFMPHLLLYHSKNNVICTTWPVFPYYPTFCPHGTTFSDTTNFWFFFLLNQNDYLQNIVQIGRLIFCVCVCLCVPVSQNGSTWNEHEAHAKAESSIWNVHGVLPGRQRSWCWCCLFHFCKPK